MSAFLLKPYPLATQSWIQSNLGQANRLAEPDPKVAWEFSSAGSWAGVVDIDLFGNRLLDTFALLYHTGRDTGTWLAFGRTDAQGPHPDPYTDDPATQIWGREVYGRQALPADGVLPEPWRHSLKALAAPVIVRWLRIYVEWVAPPDFFPFRAGVLAIGKRWQPGGALGGLDWGAGRRVNDRSTVRLLADGGRGIWRGARVPEVRGSWSHLTDAELQELWAIQKAVGESDPILMVEAADALGAAGVFDRIHYGTLTGLDFFERRQADKSRMEIRLQHWL